MSHKVETMAYVREVPWHGLGVRVEDEMTAQEAIVKAGLDWEIQLLPVYYKLGKQMMPIEDRNAIVRSTDGRCYKVPKKTFTPVQNKDAFDFFDGVVGEKQAIYHTAGSLKNGALVWILAKLPQTAFIKKVDQVDLYTLLVNAHDGSMAFQMYKTEVRVVCWNTLRLSQSKTNGDRFYARHSPGITDRVRDAQKALGIAVREFETFVEAAERIAAMSFKKAALDKFLEDLFGLKLEAAGEHPRTMKTVEKIKELVETGAGLQVKGISGTRWAVYNALTEYVDHDRYKDTDKGMYSAWFGNGSDLKARAWAALQQS